MPSILLSGDEGDDQSVDSQTANLLADESEPPGLEEDDEDDKIAYMEVMMDDTESCDCGTPVYVIRSKLSNCVEESHLPT